MGGPAGRGTLRGNVAESSSSVPLENKLPAQPLPSWALHQGHAAPGSWECAGEREQSHFPPRFFSLFRQKTVVEQIFSGFFFFFLLGLAKPQPLKNFDGNGRFPLVDFIPISPGRQRRPSGGSPLFFGRGAPSPLLSQRCLCHATRCWRDELPLQPHTHKLDQAAAVPQLQEIVLLTSEVAEVTAAAWREGTKIKQPPLPCRKCLNPVFVFTCQIRAGVCSRCGAGVNQGCLQQD